MSVARKAKRENRASELVTEIIGGEEYRYYPLGEYIVAAPGVCGGRPTIKGRRLDVRHVIGSLKAGDSPQRVAEGYKIPLAAVEEAIKLADVYDYEASYA